MTSTLLRTSIALLCVLGLACTTPEPTDDATALDIPADPAVLAVYENGEVTRDDLDAMVLELPPIERQQAYGDDAEAWYRQLINEIVIDRVLGAEIETLEASDDPILQAERREIERQTIIDAFLEGNLPPLEEVTDQDVETFYAANIDRYKRQERRMVLHLFKRRDASTDIEALKGEVAALRDRVVAGESFDLIATEESDSEARHRGGRLGWMTADQVAPELAEIIFSLPVGEPSEPLITVEGVHLFVAERAVDGKDFSIDEVGPVIFRQLSNDRLRDALRTLTESMGMPEGSYVASESELETLLATDDPSAVLLRIGELEVTAGRFVQMQRENVEMQLTSVGLLEALQRRAMVYEHAVGVGLGQDPEVLELIRRRQQRSALARLRQQGVQRKLSSEPDRLRGYYDNNQLRFSTPLRLETRQLRVAIAGGGDRAMARLEALASGDGSLDAVATELDGTINELGWRTLAELTGDDARLAGLLTQLEVGGISPPIRDETHLTVVEVTGRREPEAQPFETVLDPVRAEYLADHGQELYRDWIEEKLEDVRLVVIDERLPTGPGQQLTESPEPPSS
ncbi:MAG: peptidylprolyl isomerase [Acidobacteriota bacterium]